MEKSHTAAAVATVVLLSLFLGGYVVWDKEHAYMGVNTQTMRQYSSEDGVRFMYPDTYRLSSATHAVGGVSWDSLELVDKNTTVPQNSDGPESISVSVFANPKGLSLEEFVKSDARGNYRLSADGTLTKAFVGSEPSLAYRYSGLYENDAVAVARNNKIFIFSVGWAQLNDPIRQDFSKLLTTVTFQ